MSESEFMSRKIQLSVTVFLYHQGKYLILQRPHNNKVDSGRLNGVGGKVEANENFLQTALRETQEETGYQLTEKEMQFSGLIRTHDGYPCDWIVCFFTAAVTSKTAPIGKKCREGKFLWLEPDELFTQGVELVDDLHYLFKEVVARKRVFFADIQFDDQEDVKKINVSYLPKNI